VGRISNRVIRALVASMFFGLLVPATAHAAKPALRISDAVVTESDAGAVVVRFTVRLSKKAPRRIAVRFTTVDGTAVAGSDYHAKQQSVVLKRGKRSKQVVVQVLGDTLDELDETFTARLSRARNALIADATATAKIIDNDTARVSLRDASATEGAIATVRAELSTLSDRPVGIAYSSASGTATQGADFDPFFGTTVFLPGETSKGLEVSTLDDSLDEDDETFTVKLSDIGTDIADWEGLVTIVDDDSPPRIYEMFYQGFMTEGDVGSTDITFRVTLSAPSGRTVTIDWSTEDGSARSPADYEAASGTLTFAPGEITKGDTVTVHGDVLDEPTEGFRTWLRPGLNIDPGPGAIPLTTVIFDNDPEPSVSIGLASVTEGASGTTTTLSVPINLSAPSGKTVTVHWQTLDGTATAPADYTSVADQTITFAPGETTKQAEVTIKGDALDEDNETISMRIFSPTNATLSGTNPRAATIDDDDPAPTLSVNDPQVSECEEAAFTVSLSAASAKTVSVAYATEDGSAEEAVDYFPVSGTLTIPAGQTSGQVLVFVECDAEVEGSETFNLVLSSPSNATIADDTGVATIADG
jgi:hypothetical protein